MEKKYPDIYAVDDNDTVVGIMPLQEVIRLRLNRRVARVYVFNESGKILIQKRGARVMAPFKFDHSVGGYVDVGESYQDAAARELSEELGIDSNIYQMKEVNGPYLWEGFFAALYKIIVPDTLNINFDADEVDSVYWMTAAEVGELIASHPEDCGGGLVTSWTMFRDKLLTV